MMLTTRQATKLLRTVTFKGDPERSTDQKLAAAPKSVRSALIQQDGCTEEKRRAAAIEIQRCWRGFFLRCRLFDILCTRVSHQSIKTGSRTSSRDLGSLASPEQPSPRKLSGKSRLRDYYSRYCESSQTRGESCISFQDFCAHFIQNWWHKTRVKNKMAALSPAKRAVSIILSPETGQVGELPGQTSAKREVEMQRANRLVVHIKKKKRTQAVKPNEAASIIQQAWRRHIDVQVFRYYRDLINFRCRGNPAMMLKCINPKEARLLDAAAGIHVKFRLAGDKFPPNIYYKIFTHRTVVDMCANSPKDYTAAPVKRLAAKDVHNRREEALPATAGSNGSDDKVGWYQRVENNGWRLVSDRLILRADQDAVMWESSRKKQDFPHTKLQRREDVERKKKRKKLEWMKKMYKVGMLQAKTDDAGMNTLVDDATEGMLASLETKGPDSVEDWEVDELLQWTSGLNFDDYQKSWKEIATSAGSDTFVEEQLHFQTSIQDPFEFSLTMDSLPSSPSPSRVTTAVARTMSHGVPVK